VKRFRVTPGAQQRFLDDVLCPMPIAIGEAKRISEQGTGVFVVEGTDEGLIRRPIDFSHTG